MGNRWALSLSGGELSPVGSCPRTGIAMKFIYVVFSPTEVFSSSGPKDPMSLCHGVASVVRPSVRPSFRPSTVFKMLLLRHFSTDFDSDCFIR